MAVNSKIVQNIDLLSIVIYLVLVIMGWMNIYSSVYDGSSFDFSSRYGKQLIMIIINIILLIGILFLNGQIIPTSSYFVYALMIFALIAVLFLGDKTGGSRSWFKIGSFKLQPAEFAKLATALVVAKVAGRENFKLTGNAKNFFTIAAYIIFPAFLILMQGDAGSALVFLAFIFVLYRQGLSFYWLLIIFIEILVFTAFFFVDIYLIFIVLSVVSLFAYRLVTGNKKETVIAFFIMVLIVFAELAVVAFLKIDVQLHILISISILIVIGLAIIKSLRKRTLKPLLIPALLLFYIISAYSVEYVFNNVLRSHQQDRITVLFYPEKDITGVGYQTHQSKIAIGSGGFSGKGYLKGTQTKYDFVPEQDTDYIFCTVGEEWGFVGSSSVIILFTFLILRIIFLAERQKSIFSRIFGYSLAGVLFFHYSVNIAMTIGLAPVIGIPLPFFSYGGSSLFAFSIFLFVFLRLDAERNLLFI
ncbi:MAG: rod shape-determining protein RodA [Bacteroidales bacterium]|nr:rod shape-determining protein RodA [Bacteroidales bacterium]